VTDDKDQEKEARLKQNYEARELIRKQYRLSDTIEIGEVVVTAQKEPDMQTLKVESVRMWYGKPDNELIVTREMETLPEAPLLLMGTVAGVTVTDAGYGKYKIRIRSGIYRDQSPILLIDGIEKPLDVLNWLPVSAIDRIDILKTIGKTAVSGLGGNYGVISVITRIGNRRQDEPADTPWVVNTTIYGYDPSRVFYSPQHNPATPSGDPDLRTTLFWNPDIVLQKDRELSLGYFNADNSATIRIIVEGITSTGIPVTATTEYEITK